jgi:hypothetical protein
MPRFFPVVVAATVCGGRFCFFAVALVGLQTGVCEFSFAGRVCNVGLQARRPKQYFTTPLYSHFHYAKKQFIMFMSSPPRRQP